MLGNGYPNNPILPFYPSSDISIEAIHGDCVAIVADEIITTKNSQRLIKTPGYSFVAF